MEVVVDSQSSSGGFPGPSNPVLPLTLTARGESRLYLRLKRCLDLLLSLAGLLLLSPVLTGIAAAIALSSPSEPIFYRGTRIGRKGSAFRIWKFRTMVINAEYAGPSVTIDRDPRVTRLGRVLRRTKLDEFPELVNVLRGEMSVVGPRPEAPDWVAHYTPQMRHILQITPGITDIAQIIFRHEEQMLRGAFDAGQYIALMKLKVALQLEYLAHRSLLTDARIVLFTLLALLDPVPDPEIRALVAALSVSMLYQPLPPALQRRAAQILGLSRPPLASYDNPR